MRAVLARPGQLVHLVTGELAQVDVHRRVVDERLDDDVLVAAVSQRRPRRTFAAEVKRVATSQSKLAFRSHDRV